MVKRKRKKKPKAEEKPPEPEPEPTVLPDDVDPLAEPIIEEAPTVEEVEPEDGPFVEAIKALPEPMLIPTDRQYGEQFLPQYKKARSKLRQLAGL